MIKEKYNYNKNGLLINIEGIKTKKVGMKPLPHLNPLNIIKMEI